MTTQLPTLSGNRLHLWPILREAITFPWLARHALWKWVVVCGGLIGLMDFVFEILVSNEVLKENGFLEIFSSFVVALLQLSLYTVFCIRCHRLVLLGPMSDADVFPPRFGEREKIFFLYLYIIYGSIALVFLFGAVFGTIFLSPFGSPDTKSTDWLFLTLSVIPLSYLLGRCCMVFPATAIDLQPTFRWAWDQSRAFAWRLGILAGLLPWILSFLYNVDKARLLFGLEQHPFVYTLFTGVLWFALTTIEVAVLSIAFQELSGSDISHWRKSYTWYRLN